MNYGPDPEKRLRCAIPSDKAVYAQTPTKKQSMTEPSGVESAPPAHPSRSGSIGCLAGLATAVAVPIIVFCGILIANAMNPRCGTPGDAGGCEMGLASGTISAIVIGLGLGTVVAVVTTIAGRLSRKGTPPRN